MSAAVAGRLDECDGIFKSSARPITARLSAELIAGAYRRLGADFIRRLNGDFALALFDDFEQRLVLARDAIGVKPLYYAVTDRGVVFASEVKALLATTWLRSTPDAETIGSFILHRFQNRHDEARTFYSGVRRVLPGHYSIFSAKTTTSVKYWDFTDVPQVRCASYGEYRDAFRAQFTEAVKRRLGRGTTSVSTSGGLDSSAVYCVAERIRREEPHVPIDVRAFGLTYEPGSPADEEMFLSAIERDFNVRIARARDRCAPLLDQRDQISIIESPAMLSQWPTVRTTYECSTSLGADVMLTGGWGDSLLSEDAYLQDLLKEFRLADVRQHISETARWSTDVDPSVLWTTLRNRAVRNMLPPTAVRILRQLKHKVSAQPEIWSWFDSELLRSSRAITSVETDSAYPSAYATNLHGRLSGGYYVMVMETFEKIAAAYGHDVWFPYLDRDLVTFMTGLPPDVPCKDGVPKALLRDSLAGTLPQEIRQRKWKADFSDVARANILLDLPRIQELLADRPRLVTDGYVEKARFAAAVLHLPELIRERRISTWDVAYTVGLELWLAGSFN